MPLPLSFHLVILLRLLFPPLYFYFYPYNFREGRPYPPELLLVIVLVAAGFLGTLALTRTPSVVRLLSSATRVRRSFLLYHLPVD